MEGNILNNEKRRIPAIDNYEKEKIEASVGDLQLTAGTLRGVLDIIEFAEKNNISIERNNNEFDSLRFPGKDFGPDGEIRKALDSLLERARKEQSVIHSQFNDKQKEDWLMFTGKEKLEEQERSKISKIIENISNTMEHIEAGDYEGENLEKLKADLFLLSNQIHKIRDSKIPEELIESCNRISYVREAKEDKGYIANELYKIRNNLRYLSGELNYKPD